MGLARRPSTPLPTPDLALALLPVPQGFVDVMLTDLAASFSAGATVRLDSNVRYTNSSAASTPIALDRVVARWRAQRRASQHRGSRQPESSTKHRGPGPAPVVSEISSPQTQTMEPMDHKWQCAMCLDKPKIFGSVKDAVTYVHGKAVCAAHSRELLRLERGK